MSSCGFADKRMSIREATKVAREMLKKNPGCLIIRDHCRKRMLQRGINHRDILNTLLGGTCKTVEEHIKSGLSVYRFETNNYRVECNIFKYKKIIAITAIRKGR